MTKNNLLGQVDTTDLETNLDKDIRDADITSLPFNTNLLEGEKTPQEVSKELLRSHKDAIKEAFPNNEYLKIHLMTGEMVGLKAKASECDKVILDHLLKLRRGVEEFRLFMDLGNVGSIYTYLDKE